MTYTVQVSPEVLGNRHKVWISEPPRSVGAEESTPINAQVYLDNNDPLLLALGQIVLAIQDRGRIDGEIRSKDAEITAYTGQISQIRSEYRQYREENPDTKAAKK